MLQLIADFLTTYMPLLIHKPILYNNRFYNNWADTWLHHNYAKSHHTATHASKQSNITISNSFTYSGQNNHSTAQQGLMSHLTHYVGHFMDDFTDQMTQPTASRHCQTIVSQTNATSSLRGTANRFLLSFSDTQSFSYSLTKKYVNSEVDTCITTAQNARLCLKHAQFDLMMQML